MLATAVETVIPPARERVTSRPIIVELVGPWGVGKGTLLHALGAADPSVRIDLDVWHLPRSLLARGCVGSLGTIARLFLAARKPLWSEARQIVKLRAIHHQLLMRRFQNHRVLVLDEGPLLAMSWLLLGGEPAVTSGGLRSWWPRAFREWRAAVDLVVSLDAPNAVLAKRIRERRRYHPLKGRPDVEMFPALERYRVACARVIDDLVVPGGPALIQFRSDQCSTAEIARAVLAVLSSHARGR